MHEFLKQLERKRDLLSKVLELTGMQARYIASDDTDALLSNISDRQKLIDEIDSVQAELPDRDALRSNQECLRLVNEINGILKTIQEHDEKNEQAALGRMEELRNQLKKVNDARKAHDNYEAVGKNQIGGLYINRKN